MTGDGEPQAGIDQAVQPDLKNEGVVRDKNTEQGEIGARPDESNVVEQPEKANGKPEQAAESGEGEHGGENKKELPLPTEFEKSFSDTHKHLEFLSAKLSDFFLFSESGKPDETFRKEIQAYLDEIKETHPFVVSFAKKMIGTADQLSLLVEKGGVPASFIQKQGAEIAAGLRSRFDIMLAAAEDISGGDEGIDIKEVKMTLHKVMLFSLQFLEASQSNVVREIIEGDLLKSADKKEAPEELTDFDDADETFLQSREETQDNPAGTTVANNKKPVLNTPIAIEPEQDEEEDPDSIFYDKGLDYRYGFIEPLHLTVNFVTHDQDLRRDWLLMRDVGLVTGMVYTGKDGSTVLRSYERALPWVGPLRMERFFRFNIMHWSKNPRAFKSISRMQGDHFPEAIFLDDSGMAIQAYKAGKSSWESYKKSAHYLTVKERFNIDD